MERYKIQQRFEIVKIHYKNSWKWTWISPKNPKIIIEKPLYSQRVTVWYGFSAGGIIVPYFFENEVGVAVSVNGLRYRTMINKFLWSELENMDVEDVYF